jgi:hypothetical protein
MHTSNWEAKARTTNNTWPLSFVPWLTISTRTLNLGLCQCLSHPGYSLPMIPISPPTNKNWDCIKRTGTCVWRDFWNVAEKWDSCIERLLKCHWEVGLYRESNEMAPTPLIIMDATNQKQSFRFMGPLGGHCFRVTWLLDFIHTTLHAPFIGVGGDFLIYDVGTFAGPNWVAHYFIEILLYRPFCF